MTNIVLCEVNPIPNGTRFLQHYLVAGNFLRGKIFRVKLLDPWLADHRLCNDCITLNEVLWVLRGLRSDLDRIEKQARKAYEDT